MEVDLAVMRHLALLLILCVLYACGHKDDAKAEPYSASAEVVAIRDAALAELPPGWPAGADCDGLLWAGLAQAAGHDSDLTAARDSASKWFRRPLTDGNCYPLEAQSEVSRDMYIGLAAGSSTTLAVEALAYAHAHNGHMGEGDPFRTEWNTNVYALYERVAHESSDTLVLLFPVSQDYEKHLQLILINTYRVAAGGLPLHLHNVAGGLAKELPTDALAQAVACKAGYQARCAAAEHLILDPAYVCPTYVRGPDTACLIHKAYVASVLL